jgi:hypothetical protein
MADQDGPKDEHEEQELREAAKAVGVEDAEDKDGDELLHDAQEAGEDSASSPTQWQVDEDDATT